jgi:hypothetical protein
MLCGYSAGQRNRTIRQDRPKGEAQDGLSDAGKLGVERLCDNSTGQWNCTLRKRRAHGEPPGKGGERFPEMAEPLLATDSSLYRGEFSSAEFIFFRQEQVTQNASECVGEAVGSSHVCGCRRCACGLS